MPRGNKSKGRSRAKRQQTRGESQNLQGAQPTAEEEAASPTLGQGDAPSSPDVCTPQMSQEAASHGSPELDVPCSVSGVGAEGSDVGAEGSVAGDDDRRARVAKVAAAIQAARRDPLTRKANALIEFMMEKFKEKKSFTQADMMRVINKKYK
ncbi:hypothetical protein A6R68_15137, partial [Neotoma lepida]